MINCVEQTFGQVLRQGWALDERTTTGGAPVGLRVFGEDSMAVAADAFHAVSVEDEEA